MRRSAWPSPPAPFPRHLATRVTGHRRSEIPAEFFPKSLPKLSSMNGSALRLTDARLSPTIGSPSICAPGITCSCHSRLATVPGSTSMIFAIHFSWGTTMVTWLVRAWHVVLNAAFGCGLTSKIQQTDPAVSSVALRRSRSANSYHRGPIGCITASTPANRLRHANSCPAMTDRSTIRLERTSASGCKRTRKTHSVLLIH